MCKFVRTFLKFAGIQTNAIWKFLTHLKYFLSQVPTRSSMLCSAGRCSRRPCVTCCLCASTESRCTSHEDQRTPTFRWLIRQARSQTFYLKILKIGPRFDNCEILFQQGDTCWKNDQSLSGIAWEPVTVWGLALWRSWSVIVHRNHCHTPRARRRKVGRFLTHS